MVPYLLYELFKVHAFLFFYHKKQQIIIPISRLVRLSQISQVSTRYRSMYQGALSKTQTCCCIRCSKHVYSACTHTHGQASREAGREAGRQADRRADVQAGRDAGRQADSQTDLASHIADTLNSRQRAVADEKKIIGSHESCRHRMWEHVLKSQRVLI